jgi:DNA repair protein SbcD/Mre11
MGSILVVGDLHLGRRPSCIPRILREEWGVDPARLNTVRAWHTVVREAITRSVDAVVLAGGIVDPENRRMEAYASLEVGARELGAAGVALFAVGGGQDLEVLRHLERELPPREGHPAVRTIGKDGQWEVAEVTRDGRTVARLLGWSHPSRKVTTSPVDGLPVPLRDGIPTLGFLQCDLDRFDSEHAPVASSQLERTPVDVWMLGHRDAPTLGKSRRAGYLGSLVGLTPKEIGRRGPWIVETRHDGDVRVEQLALAPLRWERIDVSAEGILAPDDLEAAIGRALTEHHGRIEDDLGPAEVIGVSIVLTGRTPFHQDLARRSKDLDLALLSCRIDERVYFVERIFDEARPAIDLKALARGTDQPALLARHLLVLESGGGHDLVEQAKEDLVEIARVGSFDRVHQGEALGDAHVRALLLRTGFRTLESLLAQAGGPP